MSPSSPTRAAPAASGRFAALVRAFHSYAAWLVSISWWRFIALSLLLLIVASVLQHIPPFTWTISETVETVPVKGPKVVIAPPKAPARPAAPTSTAAEAPAKPKTPAPPWPPKAGETESPRPPKASETPPPPPSADDTSPADPSAKPDSKIRIERGTGRGDDTIEISIGSHGIRVTPRNAPAVAEAAQAAASAAQTAEQAAEKARRTASELQDQEIRITVPPGTSAEVRRALEEARDALREALDSAKEDAQQARRDAEEAVRDAERAIEELQGGSLRTRITRTSVGDVLPNLAFLWIVCSGILKASYKRQLQSQAKAAQATEVAESEQLKRQVVEARMAAMQAQVEPHFLFNTLASIDHLIETDPSRASKMQKDLIALLRASMPALRDTPAAGLRDLGSELAVVRPYLEILKVRMDERLDAHVDVPDGLKSAAFPPMMLQSLVENAIKHGLEPKSEGGSLHVSAEVADGQLVVRVADTGLGFGRAATQGTGTGLANIRERLQLLYGRDAALTIAANQPAGTVATVTVPYRSVAAAAASPSA